MEKVIRNHICSLSVAIQGINTHQLEIAHKTIDKKRCFFPEFLTSVGTVTEAHCKLYRNSQRVKQSYQGKT